MSRIKLVYENGNGTTTGGREIIIRRAADILNPPRISKIIDNEPPPTFLPKTSPRTQYSQLLSKLKGTNRLWEDPDFPADNSSVYPTREPTRFFKWKRPSEMVSNPRLFVDGSSRFDIKQGELGDCWVLATLAPLCVYPNLLKRLVPDGQDFEENYIGAFQFYFWKFGEWEEVIVDDRLPTEGRELVFMSSTDPSEFWSALIEKAYAKFYGNYENLCGGSQPESMVDFTGGMCETFELNEPVPKLFSIMYHNMQKSSIMGCSINVDEGDEVESDIGNGLLRGHAYSITDVKRVTIGRTEHKLIRIRNPWGNFSEWTGAWSDKSSEWNMLSDEERDSLGIVFDEDGEFWMSIEDFHTHFSKLECCHLGADRYSEDEDSSNWDMTIETGSWVKFINAGGCTNYSDSFWTNPQFLMEIDAPSPNDKSCKVLIGLMQKDRRRQRKPFLTIAYTIYKLPNGKAQRLNKLFFRMHRPVVQAQYNNFREITGYHKLEPGHYVILVSTFYPNEEADFYLRIFCEKAPLTCELDNPIQSAPVNTEAFHDTDDLATQAKELKNKFSQLGEVINYHQLRSILNYGIKMDDPSFTGFERDTCESMVELMDKDGSGKMEYDEFIRLWRMIRVWKVIFDSHDADKSKDFDPLELRTALRTAGHVVSNRIFAILVTRYGSALTGRVSFGNFVTMLIRLKYAFKVYDNEVEINGTAVFNDDLL